tara:strand:+ start:1089 stop:1250 length:162 start_codon:yes stop_codon:yes gene_type:complete
MSYKLLKNQFGEVDSTTILRKTDNACIPTDTSNTDYQEYLEWVEEGNTPDPAD